MAYRIQHVPDEPIFIVYFDNPFDVRTDIPELSIQLNAIFDAADQPLWNITVATDLQISFGQMVEGLALMTRGELSAMNHPNIAGRVIVVNQSLIRLGAEALTQTQYGGFKLFLAERVDQALERVRSEIRQSAKAA